MVKTLFPLVPQAVGLFLDLVPERGTHGFRVELDPGSYQVVQEEVSLELHLVVIRGQDQMAF